MKNTIQTSIIFLLMAFLFSCQNNPSQSPENKPSAATLADEPETKAQQTACYQGTENGTNQISLQIIYDGDQVNGYLTHYNPNGHSILGQFTGTKKEDIILADCQQLFEGATMTSEISFKIDGENIYQGSGEMTESSDRLIFKDKSNIQYNQLLTSTDCEQIAEHIQWSKEAIAEF